MSNKITITTPSLQAPQFVVLNDETMDKVTEARLLVAAFENEIEDEEYAALSTSALKDIKTVINIIESGRKEAKAPILAFGKAIDEAVKPINEELKEGVNVIQKNLLQWKHHLEKIAAEEQRKLDEERKKEEERIRAEEKKKQEEWLKNEDKNTPLPKEKLPIKVKVIPQAQDIPVHTRKIKELVIDDPTEIPVAVQLERDGDFVFLADVRKSTILALIKDGYKVPGCHVKEVETVVGR